MLNMLLVHGIEPTPEYVARMPEVLEAATVAKAASLRERGHELPGASWTSEPDPAGVNALTGHAQGQITLTALA
jgi:hypothetical protein